MDFFSDSLDRLKFALRVSKDGEVAAALGLSKTAFAERKRRQSFPDKELRSLADTRPDLKLDVDYVLTGMSKASFTLAVAGIGERIKQLRGERTESEFAAGLGVSTEDLSRIERGAMLPSSAVIQRLINSNPDVDLMWLLADQPMPQAEGLNHLESILIANYRASSDEGKAMLRQLAAACAEYRKEHPA
ncbi:MAG: helix-turn-helix transcriptional regulator [Candidatus Dechloromonas phosphoritropha]|jgi:transcriptional regulator with XRE-family HTH domain